jgi:hypothetical protein
LTFQKKYRYYKNHQIIHLTMKRQNLYHSFKRNKNDFKINYQVKFWAIIFLIRPHTNTNSLKSNKLYKFKNYINFLFQQNLILNKLKEINYLLIVLKRFRQRSTNKRFSIIFVRKLLNQDLCAVSNINLNYNRYSILHCKIFYNNLKNNSR